MKKIITKLGIAGMILLPSLAFAQRKDLEWVIENILIKYFNYAIGLTIALAVVMFVWNVYRYFISGSDNAGEKKEAGLYVLWSLVGFFVILSVWGLVNILINSFDLDRTEPGNFFPTFRSSKRDSDPLDNIPSTSSGSNMWGSSSSGSNMGGSSSSGSNINSSNTQNDPICGVDDTGC